MEKEMEITDSEVRDQIEHSTLIDFCVIFTQGTGPDERILGSGTLVSIDNTTAILTAHHVFDELPDPVRVFFPTRFDNSPNSTPRPSKSIEYFHKTKVGRGRKKPQGPDLGLLIVPKSIVPSTKTPYNLTKRRRRVLENPRPIETRVWAVVGTPEEWTASGEPQAGFDPIKEQRGVIGLGVVNNEYEQDDFDYLEFSLGFNARYEGPRCFKGCSGGGLWHIPLEKNQSGKTTIQDPILSGVVFYQSDPQEANPVIRCHGRKSIYEKAFGVIRARHPSV